MKRMFRRTSDEISVKGLLSIALLAGIAAGILVPLTMKATGLMDSGRQVMMADLESENLDLENFSTAAGGTEGKSKDGSFMARIKKNLGLDN
jgi:hypothetical protein